MPELHGIRLSASRNWWHLSTLQEITKELRIQGLEFLHEEVACLDSSQLALAMYALEEILASFSEGLPDIFSLEAEGAELFQEDPNAIKRAQSSFDIGDYDYDIELFWSFVKSLQQAINEAILQQKWLLYIQIQP
jgi:hypothetical protein